MKILICDYIQKDSPYLRERSVEFKDYNVFEGFPQNNSFKSKGMTEFKMAINWSLFKPDNK